MIETVNTTPKMAMGQEDLKAVYHLAFKSALDRYVVKQMGTPMFAEAHHASNLAYARYFTLLA